MRLVFTNADQDTFDEYRALFIRRVLDYGRKRGLGVTRRPLEHVLDFKYGAPHQGGDGLLARWNSADAVSLLLDWIPRESGPNTIPIANVRAALDAWLGFLNEEDLLDPRSDSRAELLEVVDQLTEAYQHAVAHPSEHRVASYMHYLMDSLGYDVDDAEEVAEFENQIESGELDFDAELVAAIASGAEEGPKSLLAGPGRAGYTWRAPRPLSDDELNAAIEVAPTIIRLREQAPDELAEDSVEAWSMAFAAMGDALAERLELDEDGFADFFGLTPDEFTTSILTSLFIERLALPVPALAEMAAVLGDRLDPGSSLTGQEETRFTTAVGLVLDALEKLGAVEQGTLEEEDTAPVDQPVYQLTPLGEWAGFQELAIEGYTIRDFDELMAETAEVLVERAAAGEALSDTDLDAWIAARDIETALYELVEVARRTDDSTHRAAVRAVTAEHASAARAAYEELRDDPDFGPQARVWLFDAGFAKESDLEAEDLSWVVLDSIAAMARLDLFDDEQFEEFPVSPGPDGSSLFDLALMLRHPETGFLLDWFGEHHPDPKVRREARAASSRFRGGRSIRN